MATLISLYKKRGFLLAKLNWLNTIDINGTHIKFRKIKHIIHNNKCDIERITNNLNVILEDDQINELITYALEQQIVETEKEECIIEITHRPVHVVLDITAVYNYTNIVIPEDVLLVMSWGNKFLFPYIINNNNMPVFLSQIEYAVDKVVSTGAYEFTGQQIVKHLKKDNDLIHNNDIKWLTFLKYRTNKFLKQHPEIIPVLSDKGKIIVLMLLEEYKAKLTQHLLNREHYELVTYEPLNQLIKKEKEFINILRNNPLTHGLVGQYMDNCLVLPRFYGTIKVHKECKIRPITSNAGLTVGSTLNKIMNVILTNVFPIHERHVKNASHIKNFIDQVILPDDHVLVSFDAVSMFTTIPTNLIIHIANKNIKIFKELYNLEGRFVVKLLNFVLNECTYFVALNSTYKQKHGLPMGGSISSTCCRIIMDHILEFSFKYVPEPFFVKVYVDDTLFAIKPCYINDMLRALNNCCTDIQFTFEKETDFKINFLNVTLIREGNKIITNWYRKPYSSYRYLNYYSSHKRSIILNTAIQFIKTTLELSDGRFFFNNKNIVQNVLEKNCFPPDIIMVLLNDNYTYMKPYSKNYPKNSNFIAFPHQIANNKFIKQVVKDNMNINCTLSESVKNTKINFIKNYTDKPPISTRTNMIIKSQCNCKDKKVKFVTTRYNETVDMAIKRLVTDKLFCDKFGHAFRKTFKYHGLAYRGQTWYYSKYLQWKHRNNLVNDNFQFPNRNLRKLIK